MLCTSAAEALVAMAEGKTAEAAPLVGGAAVTVVDVVS